MEQATFGERLSELLDKDNIAAYTFANKIGVSYSLASQWIRENTHTKLSNLLKIALFFDCSLDYICGKSNVRGKFNATPPTFPARLISLITKSDKTISSIFQKLNLDRTTLHYWKKGYTPRTTYLIKIADYFNVTVGYLVGIESSV